MQYRNLDEQINEFDGSLGLENEDSFIIENPEDLDGDQLINNNSNNDNSNDNNNNENENDLDVSIDLGGGAVIGDREDINDPRAFEEFEDLDPEIQQNEAEAERERQELFENEEEINDAPANEEENLYEGFLGDEFDTMDAEYAAMKENEKAEREAAEMDAWRKREEKRQKDLEKYQKQQEKEQKEQEKRKAKEAKEAREAETKVGVVKIKSYRELGKYDYVSEQHGYKDQDFQEGVMTKQAETVHLMKLTMKEVVKHDPLYGDLMRRRNHASEPQAKMMKDLNAFDNFMKEISGRTRLSPREMEVYDKLSLKAYRSAKEYHEYKLEQDQKKMEAFDKKHEKDKVKPRYEQDPADYGKIEGTNRLLENIERLRKEAFDKEMEEKAKELTEKCKKEAEKAEAIRGDLNKATNAEERKALQNKLEDSIARSIYFGKRMEDLQNKNELSIKPDESFQKAIQRIDKSIEPTEAELKGIKETEFCKSQVEKAKEMVNNGDILTNDDIQKAHGEYIKAAGRKLSLQKWREQNMRPAVQQKNPQLQQQNPQTQQQNPQAQQTNPQM